MNELFRTLAELESPDAAVLSVYLDMRPEATGENPALRTGVTVLKDRLREIEKTLGPRGATLDSFREDSERIQRFIDEEHASATRGLAIFACAAEGAFYPIEVGTPFESQVSMGPTADLYQLARLLDEQESVVVAVVDSNTARIFVTRHGTMEEMGGPDADSVHFRKRSMGGWSQARYQRHIEKHREEFAREAAAEIEQVVDQEQANRLIIAGDEVAVPLLQAALPARIQPLLLDPIPRVHIRAPADELDERVAPIIAAAEEADSRSVADQLIAAIRSGGLGVCGLAPTQEALEQGRADMLILAANAEMGEAERSELVRQAALTSADVEVVDGHEGLERLGGVGALLRYRYLSAAR